MNNQKIGGIFVVFYYIFATSHFALLMSARALPLHVSSSVPSHATTSKASTTTSSKVAVQQRFYILDFVRLVAMIMMMQGHTLDAVVMTSDLNVSEYPWSIWHFLRGLTAPTFLMISGAVQIFATKRDEFGRIPLALVWKRIKWGLMLIGLAYLLVFPANRILDLPFVPEERWQMFFQTNILHISGITLIAVIGLMSLTRSNRSFATLSFMIGIGILLASPFAGAADWFAFMPEWLAAYFSFKHGSLFTVFPFSAYMFLGVGVGYVLAEMPARERERRFPPIAFLLGMIALGFGVIGTYSPVNIFPIHDYYLNGASFALIRIGCVMLAMAALTYVYATTRRFEQYYSRLGKKSLYIYTAHLIVLFGTPWFGGITHEHYRTMTLPEGFVVAFGVVGFTLMTAYILDYFQRNSYSLREGIRVSFAAILLYALLV